MKTRIFVLVLLLALAAVPVLAQDAATNSVIFNGISFSFPSSLATNVNIMQVAGDDPSVVQPGGPTLPHSEFTLFSGALEADPILYGNGTIYVYNTADLAGYELANAELTNLQSILSQRPDLSTFTAAGEGNTNNLPYLPVPNAAQVLRAQPQYVETPSLQGVRYVTVYRQDVSPFTGSSFLYTFQGVTTDGASYVSATFFLDTALFPAEIPADFDYDALSADYDAYLSESIGTLNSATSDDFTPTMAALDGVVQSISVTPAVPVTPPDNVLPTEPTVVPVEPTATSGDATLGGLGGVTWTLTSYGSPENPTPVLEQAPVTLIFSSDGAGGSAGCNSYGGSFQFENNTLTFGQMVTTLMACDEAIMTQESAYLAALETAGAYQVSGGQLQISYEGGVLNFTAG